MSPQGRTRDPRTKQELLDRMMSFDFDGDIRHLGAEEARLKRVAPNKIELQFPSSDKKFELVVRIPRGEQKSFAPAREPEVEVTAAPVARQRRQKG